MEKILKELNEKLTHAIKQMAHCIDTNSPASEFYRGQISGLVYGIQAIKVFLS